jgi:hypothetical protein
MWHEVRSPEGAAVMRIVEMRISSSRTVKLRGWLIGYTDRRRFLLLRAGNPSCLPLCR